MKDPAVKEPLANVAEEANIASVDWDSGHKYEELTKAFCDGFGVSLGSKVPDLSRLNTSDLIDYIQQHVETVSIKHITPKQWNSRSTLWITPTSEGATLTRDSLKEIMKVVDAVRSYFELKWSFTPEDSAEISLIKNDVAADYKGSF